jgi:hypothetical protein
MFSEKLIKKLAAQALASLEEDAKNHERKARNLRGTASVLKEMLPAALASFKPVKFKPLTKKQVRALAKEYLIPPPLRFWLRLRPLPRRKHPSA